MLSKITWNPSIESVSNDLPLKRARLSSPPAPASSDPVFFSSDDDPSSENYTQDRKKRKYKGPWYQQVPADSIEAPEPKQKRAFQRQYDSGIFLGSDETDLDEVEDLEANVPTGPFRNLRAIDIPKEAISLAEECARELINKCVEDGNETIDLSNYNLGSLSDATLRPLATLTVLQKPHMHPLENYTKLMPHLKLNLTFCGLKTLPMELFRLERLVFLTLRGNMFQELPPRIGSLRNLTELNIAQNALRYLPFEFLELFAPTSNLRVLHLHPNPFYEPNTSSSEIGGEAPVYQTGISNLPRAREGINVLSSNLETGKRVWHSTWKPSFKFRTEVKFLDAAGFIVKGPRDIPTEQLDGTVAGEDLLKGQLVAVADVDDIPEPPQDCYLSTAPSLLEVALNACSRTPQLPNLQSSLPPDHPEHIAKLISLTKAKKEYGGSKCTICERNFIVPRTEWIEWWEVARVSNYRGTPTSAALLRLMENSRDLAESVIPLIRRGCSWLCVPENVPESEDGISIFEDFGLERDVQRGEEVSTSENPESGSDVQQTEEVHGAENS
ncbi:hypothetical protein B7494_g3084 [Chlorociboria aeruginascens]|nr:hypothetical protein B7494_g3084 [Chlorociboria aeruginascens]